MPKTLPAIVRRQHYVWRHYLQGWEVNGVVACLRNQDIFSTDPKNLAVKKDFYRLLEPTPQELALVRALMGRMDPAGKQVREQWIDHVIAFFNLKRNADMSDPEVAEAFLKTENDLEEDFHASIEAENVDTLAALRRGDASILTSRETALEFYYFIAVQYTRTNKLRSKVIEAFKGDAFVGIRIEVIWGMLRQAYAINIGGQLFAKRGTHKITFLEAPKDAHFITSDQPAINLDAYKRTEGEPSEHLDLYYPLSPTLALRFEDGAGDGQPVTVAASPQQIAELNQKMFSLSHESIFSHDASVLAPFKA